MVLKKYTFEFFDGFRFYQYQVRASNEREARHRAKVAHYDRHHRNKAKITLLNTSS